MNGNSPGPPPPFTPPFNVRTEVGRLPCEAAAGCFGEQRARSPAVRDLGRVETVRPTTTKNQNIKQAKLKARTYAIDSIAKSENITQVSEHTITAAPSGTGEPTYRQRMEVSWL